MYGCYKLLEKLGCRWYFPGEWGEIVPKRSRVEISDIDLHSKPDFAMRTIWQGGRWGISKENRAVYRKWCQRIGFTDPSWRRHINFYPVAGDAFMGRVIKPKEYAESNPEFFAKDKNGNHFVKKDTHMAVAALCLSNDDMLAEFIKNIREAMDGKRYLYPVTPHGVGIGPPDGVPQCYCKPCKAKHQNFYFPRYNYEPMTSEEIFSFTNKVARAFPDKLVTISAYSNRDVIPQGLDIPSNVSFMHAAISCCALHPLDHPNCWRRIEHGKTIRNFCKLSKHTWIRDYSPGVLISDFLPERTGANFSLEAKKYKEMGIRGFTREGTNSMMATWLDYYIQSRFMWDVNSDLEEIKQDFYTTFFGSDAGHHVRAWWDACEDALMASKIHPHEGWLLNNIYNSKFAGSIYGHYQKASKAKMNEAQRKRFRVFELIVQNFNASCDMNEAEKNLDYPEALAQMRRMIKVRNEINKVSELLVGPKGQSKIYIRCTKGKELRFQKLVSATGGETGKMIAKLPLNCKFKRDPYNLGLTSQWYLDDHNDSKWEMKNTFYCWDAQDEPEDATGHDYDGIGWYRAEFKVSPDQVGKPLRFFSGGAFNEAWVWINGEYAGHRKHMKWFQSYRDFEVDVSRFVKPGVNKIAIRVFNDTEIGGLYRRGFFYAPKSEDVHALLEQYGNKREVIRWTMK